MDTTSERMTMRERLATDYAWTPRQSQVLDMVARGKTNQQIADALAVSLDGAKWHMREILSKLDVETREEAGEYWRQYNGLAPRFARLFRGATGAGVVGKGLMAGLVGLVIVGIAGVAAVLMLSGDDDSTVSDTEPTSTATTPTATTSPTGSPAPASTQVTALPRAAPGSFQLAPGMGQTRSIHTASVLPDGSVLVAGGNVHGPSPVTRSAELFMASGNVFADVGQMLDPRQTHTATLLQDGRVLLAGGVGADGVVRSAEIFDPASRRFERVGELLVARAGHAAERLPDGRVVLIGGFGQGADISSEIFDPGTGQFVAGPPPIGSIRSPQSIALQDGRIFVATDGVAQILDPTTMTFTTVKAVDRVPQHPSLIPDGRVLLTGGHTAGARPTVGNAVAAAAIFDPAAGSFERLPDMTTKRHAHRSATLLDGRVLIAGGAPETEWSTTHLSAEVFDPASKQFSPVGDMADGRVFHTLSVLADGRVLVVGDNGSGASGAEIFYP